LKAQYSITAMSHQNHPRSTTANGRGHPFAGVLAHFPLNGFAGFLQIATESFGSMTAADREQQANSECAKQRGF
jgi:hypothetical protein